MENYFQKIGPKCTLCCGGDIRSYATKNSHNVYKCGGCNLLFVWPLPNNPHELYSPDYFSGASCGFGYVDYDRDKATMLDTFNIYLDKIEKFSGTKGKLLDVGAATGYFLELASRRGWEVYGVEVSDYAAKKAREKGIRVITGTWEDANFKEDYFDAICFWDVIEHLPDPNAALSHASKLIKSKGIIAFSTPDAGSMTAKLLGRYWHLLVPPEHLFLFNKQNIDDLLRNNGFSTLYIDKIGKKFALQYVAKTLANWNKFFVWGLFVKILENNFLGKVSIPINLRDNIFVLAKKE